MVYVLTPPPLWDNPAGLPQRVGETEGSRGFEFFDDEFIVFDVRS